MFEKWVLRSGFLTHVPTHNRKNGAGRKGYESRFVRKSPRGKGAKGLESCDLRVWTLFVISRSRVRVTFLAPGSATIVVELLFF